MPVQSCRSGGRPGYKWGPSGKCYSYPSGNDAARREAKRKAVIQGIAAGERPSYAELEQRYFPSLLFAYRMEIIRAADIASKQFALTAAGSDWQPPVEGAVLTVAQLRALGNNLNEALMPVWEKIITDSAQAPLARVEIAWDVKHPLAQNLLDQAAKRTGARLGEAVQFTLRDTIKHAYNEGLNVSDTADLIKSKILGASRYQAEMLARTDLNSLANGSSHAAAQLVGMEFKTWDATLDAVTRPTHADAHGQTVPLNASFDVGGEEAMYPGDPALSDAEAANCRCTLIYGETLDEAQGLLADGSRADTNLQLIREARRKGDYKTLLRLSDERGIMADMATKEQRRKRYERRAAHALGKTSSSNANAVTFTLNGEEGILVDQKLTPNTDIVFVSAPDDAIVAAPRAIRFSGTAAIEGQIADDNSLTPRVLLPDSLEWPEMPVSFMAQTVTAEGHDGAEVAGRVDEFARKRSTGKRRNIYMSGELTTPFGINEVAPMIDDETMRYVSVDLGATEWAIVNRTNLAEVPQDQLSIEDLSAGDYALGLKGGKVKAVTLVPTQALEGAMIALSASAEDDTATLVFAIEMVAEKKEAGFVASPAPVNPPRAWFETAEPPGKMPLTITKEGRVYGHLATWDSCHVSFLPSCVPPPKSASSYAYMHTSELDTEDGDTVTVGKLMFSPDNGGHADRRLSASKASAYYDKTGMAAAFIRVIDGAHGIWAAGALNPDLTDEQRQQMRRELRLNPPSGDWRPINGQYELICGLAVAVPGFPVPRVVLSVVASGDQIEMCDALIASSGLIEPDPAAVTALEHLGLVDEDMVAERQIKALAARAQGLDSLAALVDS